MADELRFDLFPLFPKHLLQVYDCNAYVIECGLAGRGPSTFGAVIARQLVGLQNAVDLDEPGGEGFEFRVELNAGVGSGGSGSSAEAEEA